MQLITNKISTGKPVRFEDFIKKFKASQIKTASVKVAAEQEEAESSGQLKVEPLHQDGESTTMPKAGPSAKKDDGEKAATADTDPEKDGKDSGQCKAEGSEKFTNNVKFDPNDSTDEEKGIDASAGTETKVAAKTCEQCDKACGECTCEECKCASCTAHQTKQAALKDLPQEVQDKIKGKSSGNDDNKDCQEGKEEKEEKDAKAEDKEEKEASGKCKDCNCDPCECKDAATTTQFVKWANLDSKNKSFLTTYWRQLFGDEYVSALVADK